MTTTSSPGPLLITSADTTTAGRTKAGSRPTGWPMARCSWLLTRTAEWCPPELRRRGYATAAVAAASQAALGGGCRHCMLYADLGNLTSNAIYQRVGYRRVGDASEYRFTGPGGT